MRPAPPKVLALDPAKRAANNAYAVCTPTNIVAVGNLTSISDLRHPELARQVEMYADAIRALLARHQPTHVVAERFQVRPGRGGGATVEYINVMLGILSEVCSQQGVECLLVLPATWKQWAKREYGETVTDSREWFPDDDYTVHRADAVMIATWMLESKLH